MPNCATSGCNYELDGDQQLCTKCIAKKWGVEPRLSNVLPDEIILHIASFCDLLPNFARCRTFSEVRFLLAMCANDTLRVGYMWSWRCLGWFIRHPSRRFVAEYMMDRCGQNPVLTCRVHDSSDDPLTNALSCSQFKLVERFPPECKPRVAILSTIIGMPHDNDNAHYWFLSYFPVWNDDVNLIKFLLQLCQLKSLRCMDILVQRRMFRDPRFTDEVLRNCILQESNMTMIKYLWHQHRASGYCAHRDDYLLNFALTYRNLSMLDFLTSLPNFSVDTTRKLWYHAIDRPGILRWMTEHCSRFKELWDMDMMWLGINTCSMYDYKQDFESCQSHERNTFMLALCKARTTDVVVNRLTTHTDNMSLLQAIVYRHNWELFFTLLEKYSELIVHVNWSWMLVSLLHPQISREKHNVMRLMNWSYQSAILLAAIATDDIEQVDLAFELFGTVPIPHECQTSLLREACRKHDAQLIRHIPVCIRAVCCVLMDLVLENKVSMAKILCGTICRIVDIRECDPLFAVKIIGKMKLDLAFPTLILLTELRDCTGAGFAIRDFRKRHNALLRYVHCARVPSLILRGWIESFQDPTGHKFMPGDLRDLRRGYVNIANF